MEFQNKRASSSPWKAKFSRFFERQGFYVVLLVCLAIVGVTAFFTLRSTAPEQTPQAEMDFGWENGAPVEQQQDQTLLEAQTQEPDSAAAAPTPSPTPKPRSTTGSPKASITFDPPVSGSIIVGYADKSLVYSKTLKQWTTHLGLDFAAPEGTEVRAVMGGVVEKVTKDDWMGYQIFVKHDGDLRSLYANLQEVVDWKEGSPVNRGQVIGKVGSSALAECADPPHLHFELSVKGKPVDPVKYLNAVQTPMPASE